MLDEPVNAKTERPISLHVTSLPNSGGVWSKRTSGGLVGAASRARGWLRSYHPPSSPSSVEDAVDSSQASQGSNDGLILQPPSPSSHESPSVVGSTIPSSTAPPPSNALSSQHSTVVACITPAFAASLNAALASGPLTPTSSAPLNNPPTPTHQEQYNSTLPAFSVANNIAASGPGSRPNSLPPGLAPGHGLLSALMAGNSGSGANNNSSPTLRPTPVGSSSTTSSASSSTSSSSSTTTSTTTATTTGGPAGTASSSMSSAYSQVVTSIAQRNSQAQQQQQQGWSRHRTYKKSPTHSWFHFLRVNIS